MDSADKVVGAVLLSLSLSLSLSLLVVGPWLFMIWSKSSVDTELKTSVGGSSTSGAISCCREFGLSWFSDMSFVVLLLLVVDIGCMVISIGVGVVGPVGSAIVVLFWGFVWV